MNYLRIVSFISLFGQMMTPVERLCCFAHSQHSEKRERTIGKATEFASLPHSSDVLLQLANSLSVYDCHCHLYN